MTRRVKFYTVFIIRAGKIRKLLLILLLFLFLESLHRSNAGQLSLIVPLHIALTVLSLGSVLGLCHDLLFNLFSVDVWMVLEKH